MLEYLRSIFTERAASFEGSRYAGAEMEDKVRLGMALFLASLGVLFVAGMVADLVIRTGSAAGPPPGGGARRGGGGGWGGGRGGGGGRGVG